MDLIHHSLTSIDSSLQDASKPEDSIKVNAELLDVDIILIKSVSNHKQSEQRYINGKNSQPSVHIIIGRDGCITQQTPYNKQINNLTHGAWEGVKNLSSKTIIIGMENYGRIKREADTYVTEDGLLVNTTDVFTGIHQNEESLSYWHKYTEKQLLKAEEIIRSLKSTYQVKYILGNEEVCPGLQTDPGPAFPLQIIKKKIMKEFKEDKSDEFNIKNIADQINLNSILCMEDELSGEKKEAKIVNIRKKSGGWYKVNIDLGGFMKEEWVNI